MVDSNQEDEFAQRVFTQFMDIFITPEVSRRQEEGKLEKPLDLRAAQIIFFPDDRKPQVRINSEVRAIAKAKYKPGITKKVGEPLYEHELEGLEEIKLTDEDDPNCGHATLMRIAGEWVIAFDFRRNKALSKRHIDKAEEFYVSSEFCLGQKKWSPFVDNLFSAAELAAKSILLSMADPNFRNKASHRAIHSKYNQFARLGNVEPVYRDTFNKLSRLRYPARYLKGPVSITESEARKILDIIKRMIEDARWRNSV